MDNKKIFTGMIIGVLIAMLLVPNAAAIALDTSCNPDNNQYTELIHNSTGIVFNNTFICPNGCADNGLECDSPAAPEYFFAFAVVFSMGAFIFAYIALKLNEEYKPLQFMFLAFSVLYITFVVYLVSGFTLLTLNNLNTILVQSYIVGIFTMLGLVFYFVYLLVRKLSEMLLASKNKGRPIKW